MGRENHGQYQLPGAAPSHVILGINEDGHKEVLSITIGENESAKFWLAVLNELKNRGVRDVFVLCADGLTGVKEAICCSSTSRVTFSYGSCFRPSISR